MTSDSLPSFCRRLEDGGRQNIVANDARGGGGLGAMTIGRSLLFSAFVCLVIVVLTHVAEKLHVFPQHGVGLAR